MQTNLKTTEIDFYSLFRQSSEAILIANQAGTILIVNTAAEKLFGYQTQQLVNQPIEILIPKNIAKHHHNLRNEYNANPTPRAMGSGRDLYGLRKDGTEIPIEISLSPFSNHTGNYVIAFVIDITVRKKLDNEIVQQKQQLQQLALDLEKRVKDRTMILEEALQQLEISREELKVALEKEKELNELKSRFVSMASHEFRTPLATILSSLSLIHKYGELNEKEKQQKHIARIKESITHLTDLLNDVLSISKLEEGKTSIQVEAFNLYDFTTAIISELKMLKQKNQQLIYNHEGLTEILHDKKGLRIIFFNLISNAIKFSAENTAIEISTNITTDFCNISIKDYGIGISPDDKEHLFQRFFRGKNVTNIQGTGLGLSIVARYIELFNGTIDVDTTLNEGTTFNIVLPNQFTHE
jgi:PAS domain S-box-containing protein